jgi:ABC-type polysaccharide/polyol phosphate export permease
VVDGLKELFDRRDLLYIVTWREIKIKYKQSVMGMAWAVLMPCIIVCAGLIVRFAFARLSGNPLTLADLAFVAVKAAPWAFFVSALRFGANSLVANTNLVTKVYMPRLVFPIAAVFSQLFDFVVAGVVITVFLVISGVGVSVHLIWVPVLIVLLVLLATAFAIMFSAATLFFRDVKYIVEVILTFAIFFTPVFYESHLFGPWAPLLLVNPVSPLLEGLSTVVILHQSPPLFWFVYSSVVTAVLFILALLMFQKLDPFFAESI